MRSTVLGQGCLLMVGSCCSPEGCGVTLGLPDIPLTLRWPQQSRSLITPLSPGSPSTLWLPSFNTSTHSGLPTSQGLLISFDSDYLHLLLSSLPFAVNTFLPKTVLSYIPVTARSLCLMATVHAMSHLTSLQQVT
jgi:hypothetical protein